MINLIFVLMSAYSTLFASEVEVKIPYSQTWIEISSNTNDFDFENFQLVLRTQVIQSLAINWFSGFVKRPYENWENAITFDENWNLIVKQIDQKDDLDKLLETKYSYKNFLSQKNFLKTLEKNKALNLTTNDIKNLKNVYLFKNSDDLNNIGYLPVSRRSRKNSDEASRRWNISTAFRKFGNVRVINPWESFSYMENIDFDSSSQENYKNGYAIINWKEEMVYGWGLCGGSTAIYQWVFLNTALDIKTRNHSKWYSNLYPAYINNQLVSTPGLDSTIYEWAVDLHIKNISNHPVIIVANYDWKIWSFEENFSISLASDMWGYSFLNKYKTKSWYSCYVWSINWKEKTSCYKDVL